MPNTAEIIQGLQILRPYSTSAWYTSAEHDVLHTDIEVENTPPEIAAKLEELGWHKEYDCWAAFT